MRTTPESDLLDEADLDAAIQLHIDVYAHLINQRQFWRPDTDEKHIAWAVCVTCRDIIGESHFGATHSPIDLDDIPWAEHELLLLEHEYGIR